MKPILSLDLGTNTGWALLRAGSISSGTQSFATDARFEGGGMRYLKFERWLDEMMRLADAPFLCLTYEEVRNHAGVTASHVYGGFLATLTKWCELRQVPYEGVPVGTIKKHWARVGNASKEVMIRVAVERGFNPADDNEADALALLHWTQHRYETTSPSPVRPTLHRKPTGWLQVGNLPVARRPVSR